MTAPTPSPTFEVPRGHVCCTTWGLVRHETMSWLWETRAYTEQQGLTNVRWHTIHGNLVDKARNEAARQLLADKAAGWLLFVDADMVGEPNAIFYLLQTAFGSHKHLDVVGGYANLRGLNGGCLPTMDTGTGTWESWFPGQGVVGVMRTGAAFLLIKRHVLERIPDPWFALRVPMRPLDAIAEVDTYCRTIFNGQNPFRDREDRAWERMVGCATQDRSVRTPWVPGEVGEDSSFCDRVTGAGMKIGVQTDCVLRHLETVARDWTDHRKYLDERERQDRLLVGMTA